MTGPTPRSLLQAALRTALICIALLLVAAVGIAASTATGTTRSGSPSAALPPARALLQGSVPTVNGLFYGDGDYLRYSLLAGVPGESELYYYLDGTDLYAALVIDQAFNDNVFGNTKLAADKAYVQTAGWKGNGNQHNFTALLNSDHSVWVLFCGGDQWEWKQDYLWDPNSGDSFADTIWLSDPYGPDGSAPPPAFITSASSLQWNLNYWQAYRPLGWDITLGGTRTSASAYKSLDADNDNDVLDEGWTGFNSTYQWEWSMIYECKIDVSVCGGNPFTLWPVTGHNSPPKTGTTNETSAYDWGDLPDIYGTLGTSNGPVHTLTTTLYLGGVVDPESDGQPDAGALGDDSIPSLLADDEDGVYLSDHWVPGTTAEVTVRVTNMTGVTAYLYGYVDWNGDGDFNDANEVAYVTVPTGTDYGEFTLSFGTVPATVPSYLYSRFRLGTVESEVSSPTGPAIDGEVEDYVIYPTFVAVSHFGAYLDRGQVVVEWQTGSELGTLGFNLLRQDEATGEWVRLNQDLLPAMLDSPAGATYRFVDATASPGKDYSYDLVEVQFGGAEVHLGPYVVRATGSGESMSSTFAAQGREVSAQHSRPETGLAEQGGVSLQRTKKAGDRIKITVREPGLYFVDAAEIAGLLGTSSPSTRTALRAHQLQLSTQGADVAYVVPDDLSGLYFYAEALQSIYSADNVYWLAAGNGLTMQADAGRKPTPVGDALTFNDTAHAEGNQVPAVAFVTDPEADLWMWDLVSGSSAKGFTVSAPDAANSGSATLVLHLYGTVASQGVQVSINGTPIGSGSWDGPVAYDLSLPFAVSLLNTGDNTISLLSTPSAGQFYVNSFDLTYPRLYRAVDNQLAFRGDDNPVVTVGGFDSEDIVVLDLTSPRQPKQVMAVTVDQAAGSYRVTVKPASPETPYLATTFATAGKPASMAASVSANLNAASNHADYVVIAPSVLKGAAQLLADYRGSMGHQAAVVELESIYDEFNYGLASPHAIKAFLSRALQAWQVPPQYVVLAGEGTFDYKNFKGYGDNLIPVMMRSTPYGMFAADNAFADVVGDDGVPDMAIGRLPVATNAELEALVLRMQAYEAAEGDWARKVLMVADDDDNAGDFTQDSDSLAALVPTDRYDLSHIHLSAMSIVDARASLRDQLNAGAAVFNYLGHGVMFHLAHEQLLTSAGARQLTNEPRLPVALLMTCLAGRFEYPGFDSIAEVMLLDAGGGAAAVWAPTGLSLNDLAVTLDRGFFNAVFQSGEKHMGLAVQQALTTYQAQGGAPFMLDIFNLLGDPALSVK